MPLYPAFIHDRYEALELIGLDDKDVDFSASLIKVTGKRNKQRLIPFDKDTGRSMQDVDVESSIPVPLGFFCPKEWRKAWPRYRSIYYKVKPVKGSNCKEKKSHVLAYLCNGYADNDQLNKVGA